MGDVSDVATGITRTPETTAATTEQQIKRQKCDKALSKDEMLDGWTKCNYFLERKMRLCNMAQCPGSLFCGNHRPDTEIPSERVLKLGGDKSIERIPCPIDPSHTIYTFNLDTHVKICNATRHLTTLTSQPYFCTDCNSGQNSNCIDDVRNALTADDLAKKIVDCFETYVSTQLRDPHETDSQVSIEEKCVARLAQDQTSFKQVRHVKQDAALICQMLCYGLFSNTDKRTYIELGAGKGKLGVSLNAVNPSADVVFVERSGQRRRADRVSDANAASFHRIRMDIRHCWVAQLPAVADSHESVIVAKHLCGVATDLALRSLAGFKTTSAQSLLGVSIATCCHHACIWKDYCGADWLLERGFTSQDFEVMKHWSGWATSFNGAGRKQSDESEMGEAAEHTVALEDLNRVPRPVGDNEELQRLGFMTKRILDHGRVEFIKSLRLTATQLRYCSPELSPECFAILGIIDNK